MNRFHSYADRYRKVWVTVMGMTATVALFLGVVGVVSSDLFTVRVVEVVDLGDVGRSRPEEESGLMPKKLSPLDAQQILKIAQVPTESTNLFSLKLGGIEKRLLSHPWIKGVTISKHFPQTVSLSVVFREPAAIIQNADGALFYIDSDGTAFAPLNLKSNSDLPVLINFSSDQVISALRFIQNWSKVGLDPQSLISSLEWDVEKGLQVMATYPLSHSPPGRVRVELGQALTSDVDAQLGRLREVLSYLSKNEIRARQVFADLGKKIVVKIARSS